MAKHGFMIEKKMMATNVDSKVLDCVCSTNDIDGGMFVSVTPKADGTYTATKVASGKSLAIVTNPAEKYLVDGLGNVYAGLSDDIRNYTNLKGRHFTALTLESGDYFAISYDSLDTTVTPVVGAFVVPTADGFKGVVTAAASIAGTELAAYEIVAIEDVSELFPPVKGKIGFDKENVVICHVK